MERRTFVRGMAAAAGSVALGGSLWRGVGAAAADPVVLPSGIAGPGTEALATTSLLGAPYKGYGSLGSADGHGLRLPQGFHTRVIARSGDKVGGSDYRWHSAPDGGACFPDGQGWIYVSNSEIRKRGGVGAVRFAADATITGAYRILDRTERNCAGGATPWNTWLSCEEVNEGAVFETDPYGKVEAIRRPAMGLFRHEAAAVDPVRKVVYLTEDEPDGCFYRFVPATWPSLAAGRLEVLVADGVGPVRWEAIPDPSAKDKVTRRQVAGAMHFDGGEGCVFGADSVWFTTKGDYRVWRVDAAKDLLEIAYDALAIGDDAPLIAGDNITRTQVGELFVAEDGGRMEVCVIGPDGSVAPFLRVTGQTESELTGPAFSPDGSRLYFSSQRGRSGKDDGGVTYEITGPFRRLALPLA